MLSWTPYFSVLDSTFSFWTPHFGWTPRLNRLWACLPIVSNKRFRYRKAQTERASAIVWLLTRVMSIRNEGYTNFVRSVVILQKSRERRGSRSKLQKVTCRPVWSPCTFCHNIFTYIRRPKNFSDSGPRPFSVGIVVRPPPPSVSHTVTGVVWVPRG